MTGENKNHEVDEIDCVEAFDHFYEYLNGELDDAETRAQIEHHLRHCRSCFSRSQMEKELNERMKKSGRPDAPESLQRRVHELMKDF